MGSYNCKDCFDRDISVMNELLINANSINNESIHENMRNTRSDRIKILKSSNSENEIINIETLNTGIKLNKIPSVKNLKKNQKILRKEERDNNILLKTELNKINDINIDMNNINQKNQLNNSEEIKKIIELQRKQILAQEKIIEEYKNKQLILDKQKKELEQTQQNLLAKSQNIDKKKSYMMINNTQFNNKNIFPKIRQSQTAMRNIKQKLSLSKSTPKLKIKKDLQNNDLPYNDIEPNMIPFQSNQFEKTLILKPNFNNFEENIEENDNYERVDEFNEENEYLMNSNQNYQSKKFKIETYEPIEQGNKNENNDNYNNYNEIFDNNKLILEPRDSINNNLRKAVKYKSNNNNEKSKKNKKNKKDLCPKDSGQNGVNINFRGTFENENKHSIKKDIFNIKQIGPRDSRRKEEYEFNNDNNNDNNDYPYIISNDNIIEQVNNNNEVLISQPDIFNNNNNNIYFSSEYNIHEQESPKFNSDINSSMQNEEMNAANYEPYLNQVDDINVVMSPEPVIFPKDNQIQDINNYAIDNPLLYSDDKININYLENKNEFFQE